MDLMIFEMGFVHLGQFHTIWMKFYKKFFKTSFCRNEFFVGLFLVC